jgi:hypothetical protein
MKFLKFFARTEIFFYSLLWLMFLLVVGTLAQRDVGLYLASETYFSSYIYWLFGFIPTPGGFSILAVIFVNLFAKLAIEDWERAKIGTIVIHIGALLLLFGGGVTAFNNSEGNMVIDVGGSSNFVADYNLIELALVDSADDQDVAVFAQSEIKKGARFKIEDFGLDILINDYCRNCDFKKSKNSKVVIERIAEALNPEDNIAAANLSVNGFGVNERFDLVEFIPITRYIDFNGRKYYLEFRAKRTYLPFSVSLEKLTKELHPGTDMARSYVSEVVLKNGDSKWNAVIRMNHPMRYRDYSFFQSSLIEDNKRRATVLAVVKNSGRIFPYLASIIMCIGMLIHIMQFVGRGRK